MKKQIKNQNINEIIQSSGKKSYVFFFYFLMIFIFFGSLGAFDIVVNFVGQNPEINYFNLIIGSIFSLISLIALVLLIVFLCIPNQILDVNFKEQKLVIKNKRTLDFKDLYFAKGYDFILFNFLFKYSKLKLYTHDGECIKLNYLVNAIIIKRSLETMLKISDKNVYQTKSPKLFFIRIFHYLLSLGNRLVYHKESKILERYDDIAKVLKERKISKVLIVGSPTITRILLDNDLKTTFKENNIEFCEFHDVSTNPTLDNCIKGKEAFITSSSEAIIAIGGGSTIDCAKGIAAIAYTNKPLKKFKGPHKIHHKIPLMIALPTTCGTGSETTFATVITDENTHEKFVIVSNKMVPNYTLLDVNLLKELPLHFVGSTAIDAFVHALESYLNLTRDRKSKKYSLEAMKMIYLNLLKAKSDPTNLEYRRNLLIASFIAGKAFSRAFVGPIHALSHALGGKYNLGHGYLNAILLPRFLNVYLYSLCKDLAKISNYIGIKTTNNVYKDAKNLINFAVLINNEFNFKQELDMLNEGDIKELATHAYKEASLLYPSKHFVDIEMYEDILISLLKK